VAGVAAASDAQSVLRVDAGASDRPPRQPVLLPDVASQNMVLEPLSTKEKRSKINQRMNKKKKSTL
jgi:hypothetical protein